MSTHVIGYTEAKIDGKWYCIDFFQYDKTGHIHHQPCIEGQSMVASALDWDCEIDRIAIPTDLSEQVRATCTGSNGKLFGESDPHWNPWHMVKGSWFASVNLSQPEYCGFFPREDIANYLSDPSNPLDENCMLPAEDYHELSEEERKAYQYYEYTAPYGNRQIMRDFKECVLARIKAWNNEIAYCDDHAEINLSDVRVLIIYD